MRVIQLFVTDDAKLIVLFMMVAAAFVNCLKRARPLLPTETPIFEEQLSNRFLTSQINRLFRFQISKIGQQRTYAF